MYKLINKKYKRKMYVHLIDLNLQMTRKNILKFKTMTCLYYTYLFPPIKTWTIKFFVHEKSFLMATYYNNNIICSLNVLQILVNYSHYTADKYFNYYDLLTSKNPKWSKLFLVGVLMKCFEILTSWCLHGICQQNNNKLQVPILLLILLTFSYFEFI